MSTPNDYITHGELKVFMTDLLAGIGDMIQQSENRMKMYIENGVQKQVQALSEKVDAMDERLGRLEVRVDAIETHLGAPTEEVHEIKEIVSTHDEEIITLKRVK